LNYRALGHFSKIPKYYGYSLYLSYCFI